MKVSDFPDQGRPGYIVVNASMAENLPQPIALRHDEYAIVRDCPFCRKGTVTVVPAQGLWDWEHGKSIQQAFPYLNANESGQVMTGTHGECWDRYMSDPEENEE